MNKTLDAEHLNRHGAGDIRRVGAVVAAMSAISLLLATPLSASTVDRPTEGEMDSAKQQYNPALSDVYIQGLQSELAQAVAARDTGKQIAYHNLLAQVYSVRGDTTNAVKSAQAAVTIWNRRRDLGNLHYADSLKILGSTYRKAKRHKDALPYYQAYRTYVVQSRMSPEKIADATLKLAFAYGALGQRDKEIPLLTTSVASQNQYAKNQHLVLRTKLELAISLFETNHLSPATVNGQAGQTVVRLLKEVASGSAAEAKTQRDVSEARGYLKTLGM